MMDEVRILQGDCLELMAGLPAASVDAVVTDPPWGIDYKSGRKCILMEKDPRYIPIIERRLRDAATPLFAEAM